MAATIIKTFEQLVQYNLGHIFRRSGYDTALKELESIPMERDEKSRLRALLAAWEGDRLKQENTQESTNDQESQHPRP